MLCKLLHHIVTNFSYIIIFDHYSLSFFSYEQLLIDTVAQYTQEASHCIHMKLFRVKMSLRSERSGKIEHRELIMLHRLDVQRLSGKKNSEWVWPNKWVWA